MESKIKNINGVKILDGHGWIDIGKIDLYIDLGERQIHCYKNMTSGVIFVPRKYTGKKAFVDIIERGDING